MRRLALFALLLSACPAPVEPDPEPVLPIERFPRTIGGDRPAEVLGPQEWRRDPPLPVVFLLHGFGASGLAQDLLFRLGDRVEERQFILVLPDGTQNEEGTRFWNATDACCDFTDTGVDDVGYLMGLLDELEEDLGIGLDRGRVYFTGHSNGGFMSYRMACEHPERVAAIAPLAGATWLSPADCTVGDPVSVLHLHGDEDDDVPYFGDPDRHPGALESIQRWAGRAGCDLNAAEPVPNLDLLNSVDGDETVGQRYVAGCDAGITNEIWTLQGVGHVPFFNDEFANHLLDWLLQRRN